MKGLFITATDTGAGKTFVTAALARIWRRQGRPFRVCKPVATGAEGGVAEDTRLLAEAAGDPDYHRITPFAFPVAAAPPVAARSAGVSLMLADLVGAVRDAAGSCGPGIPARPAPHGQECPCHRIGDGVVLVEGVGGLLCPLTERETVADLAAELGLPLVVVAHRSLGTLNHTLLTLEAAQRRGLRVVGVVVSETTPVQGVAEETNVEELRRRIDVPLLAVVPHQPDRSSEVAALAAVDWWRLIG